jgi:uncharacterized SAM-binding protein YcdF (DUF218 family)
VGALAAIIGFVLWFQTESSSGFQSTLKEHLRKTLVSIDPVPPETKADAVYILGGSQKSLALKFKKAAALYHQEICKNILILHRPGKTEYSPTLGRNLKNDEWAIMQLESFGVPNKCVEPIPIEPGFFGTLTEAEGISKLIKERQYNTVLLISSPSHTHRVKICFEHLLQNTSTKMYMQGSEPESSFVELTTELIKLKVYQYFLL